MRVNRLILVLLLIGSTVFSQDGALTAQEKAQFGMAQSLNNTQKFRKAIPLLKALHEKHPSDWKIKLEYAKSLGYGGSPKEAIPLLKALARERPDDTYARKTLASVYETAQMPKEAREVYGLLLKSDSDDREMIAKMASLSVWLKDDKAAAKYFQMALKAKDEEPMRRQLVEALLRAGDLTAAEKASVSLPEGKISSERLAQVAGGAQGKGDWSSAARIYRELLERKPGDRTLRLEFAKAIGYAGSTRKAIAVLEELEADVSGDIPVLRVLASMYETSDNPGKAQLVYQKLLEKMPDDRALKIKVADTAAWAGNYDVAEKAYREVLQVQDANMELKQKLINILYATGKDEVARRELSNFMKTGAISTERMMEIAGELIGRLELARALALYRDILSVEPDNRMAALWEARILSWQRLYPEAIQKYDALMTRHPDWVLPAREKARVYGWARRYRDSLEELDAVAKRFPQEKGVPLEREAKAKYHNMRYRAALKAYDRWSEEEPGDLEALFDRAQILSILKKWSSASDAYRQILKKDASHFRSRQALARVEMESGPGMGEMLLERFVADSSSRDVDRDSETASIVFATPAVPHLEIGGRFEHGTYRFKDSESRVRHFPQVIVALFDLPLSSEFGIRIGEGRFEDATNWFTIARAVLTTRPIDALGVEVAVITDHLADNNEVIYGEMERETHLARAILDVTRRLAVAADIQEDLYSDDNERVQWGIDATAHVPSGANDLSITLRHEEYGFDDDSELYFSPDDFRSDQVTIQWRQFFGKTELFWGSDTKFYTLKYTLEMDSNDEVGHTFYGDIHMDVNPRSRLSAEFSKTVYEDSGVYEGERIALYGRFFF